MKNKVRIFRQQQKLTQRELAERAGTSQQQIQRIEAGTIATSLATATAIASALGKPFDAVFPEARAALGQFRETVKRNKGYTDDDLEQASAAGVEADPSVWFFKVYLHGRAEAIVYPIEPSQKRALFKSVQYEESDPASLTFVIFDSRSKRVAINLAEMTACHFLMEPAVFYSPTEQAGEPDPDSELEEEGELVVLLPAGGGPAITFSPEMDVPDEEGYGQLGNVFFYLESAPSPSDRLFITDADGEDLFIRAGNIALLEVPVNNVLEGTAEEDSD